MYHTYGIQHRRISIQKVKHVNRILYEILYENDNQLNKVTIQVLNN